MCEWKEHREWNRLGLDFLMILARPVGNSNVFKSRVVSRCTCWEDFKPPPRPCYTWVTPQSLGLLGKPLSKDMRLSFTTELKGRTGSAVCTPQEFLLPLGLILNWIFLKGRVKGYEKRFSALKISIINDYITNNKFYLISIQNTFISPYEISSVVFTINSLTVVRVANCM